MNSFDTDIKRRINAIWDAALITNNCKYVYDLPNQVYKECEELIVDMILDNYPTELLDEAKATRGREERFIKVLTASVRDRVSLFFNVNKCRKVIK